MDSVKDIFVSFKDWLHERVSNPLIAAFVATWLVLNWRVLLILFDNKPAIDKIRLLDQKFFTEWWHWPYYGLLSPLIAAVIYVSASPMLFRFITVRYRKQQHKSKLAMLEADQIEPISPDEAARLRAAYIDVRLKLKAAAESAKIAETDLLDRIQTLTNELEVSRKATPAHMTQESLTNILDESVSSAVKPSIDEIKANVSTEALTPAVPNVSTNLAVLPRVKTPWLARKNYSELFDIEDNLSEEAKILLGTAAGTSNGSLSLIHGFMGTEVKVDGVEYFPNMTHRMQLEIKNAFDELQTHGLIELIGENSTTSFYIVTLKGYELSDLLVNEDEIASNESILPPSQ